MTHFSIETRTKKHVKGYGFCNLEGTYLTEVKDNYWTLLQKTELYALKTVTKKVTHKAAEATGEFMGNKISSKIVKPKSVSDVYQVIK